MRYIDIEPLLQKRSQWGQQKDLWKNEKLREDFRDYFHNKCWYTEVKLVGQDAHIDHFRPKKEIKQFEEYRYNKPLSRRGYYWLRNDPSNYRVCCIYANRITGGGGKGCYFPLANSSPLLTEDGVQIEEPLLLDPCKAEDVRLISFMAGHVESTSKNPKDITRVKVSVKIYNIDNMFIKPDRIKVWNEVEKILIEYDAGETSERACIRKLSELVSREAQFSACAIACVNSLAPDNIKEKLDLML